MASFRAVVFFQVWGNEEQEIYRSGWGARGRTFSFKPFGSRSRHSDKDGVNLTV